MMRLVAFVAAAALVGAPAAALAQAPTPASPPRPVAFAALSLAQAEQQGVSRSPDVAAAEAVVRENDAAYAAARGALGPALTASYAEAPQGGGNGETIAQRLTTVGVQTTVGDVLAHGSLVTSAQATLASARASLAAAQRAERVKVVGLYYDALKARAVDGARAEALATATQQRDAAAVRVRAGDAARLDLVRANVAVARAQAALETARAADDNAAEALAVETGTAALRQTVDGATPPPSAVPPSSAAALATAHRADLRAAQETTAAARAAATAAHRQTYPAVTLSAGYTSGVDGGVRVHGPSLNVALNLPLNGSAGAVARQKDAAAQEALAKQQALQRQIALDVAASVRNVEAAQRAAAATTQARVEAQAELAATELGYRNGASSSLELAAARDTYAQALVDELSSLYDELKARATVDLETGP